MKRKSLFILALLIAALTSLFTSCSASVEPPKSEEVMAYVTFGNEGSRSLNTEYGITPYDSLFWDYDAVKMDGYGTTGAATKAPVSKDPSDNQIIGLSGTVGPLSQGAWEFTLYAYEAVNGAKSDNLVYQGKSDVVVLKGGETKAVPVSVELKGEKGTLNFTDAFFSWDEEGGTGDVYLRINIKGTADNSTAVDATRIAKVTNSEGYKIKSALDFGYGVNLFPAGYYTCTVQAYVEGDLNSTKTEVNSDSTYKASQSFGLRVYGNAITYIKGNLEESLFADVIFDVEKQEMKVFTPVAGAATTVPDITVTPLGESGKTTSVTFSSGALPAISVGETLQLDVRVTPLQSSNQKFEISGTTEDNKSAFAGIDITLWKTDSSGSEQVSDFGTQTATVTTYIEKNLSNVSVHYKKTASDAADIKTNYAIETIAEEPVTVAIHDGKDGVYYKDTGKLIFVTTHFSEYYVLADCEAVITSANVGYASIHYAVAAAAKMSSQVDNTVTLTRNVNLINDLKLGTGERGVSLNLNGKTIDGGSHQVYTAGSGITTIFGNGTIKNNNNEKNSNCAALYVPAESNVIIDGATIEGYYGVYVIGSLSVKKAVINAVDCGIAINNSAQVEIGFSTGNNVTVYASAGNCISTQAAAGETGMRVNVYGGTFTSVGKNWKICPVYWASHGTLNVYGGTFSNHTAGTEAAAIYQKNGTINIYDGEFSSRAGVKLGAEESNSKSINLNIYGGKIEGTNHAALYYKTEANGSNCTAYNINISGGEFTGLDSKGAIYASINQDVIIPTVNVTGGTFSSDPSNYVINGYGCRLTSNGYFEVVTARDAGYKIGPAMPVGPIVSGNVWTVNPSNAQYTLDGAYGSINGKTINFSAGEYSEKLIIGRPTKYSGSNTVYKHGSHNGTALSYGDFIEYKSQGGYTEYCYYNRSISNVTFTANSDVVLPGFTVDGGAHVYGTQESPIYDYVRDKGETCSDTNDGYYTYCELRNISFKGLTFNGRTIIETSAEKTIFDGFTFENCTFNINNTFADNQALRFYTGIQEESENSNIKNLVVKKSNFNNCYQGVYANGVYGVTVTECNFNTTTHNAIAIQDNTTLSHGPVVITNNTFKNIGDRIIRFGNVGADTQITIQNNTATDSGNTSGEVIKAESLDNGITYNISGNSWGERKTVANTELIDQ